MIRKKIFTYRDSNHLVTLESLALSPRGFRIRAPQNLLINHLGFFNFNFLENARKGEKRVLIKIHTKIVHTNNIIKILGDHVIVSSCKTFFSKMHTFRDIQLSRNILDILYESAAALCIHYHNEKNSLYKYLLTVQIFTDYQEEKGPFL